MCGCGLDLTGSLAAPFEHTDNDQSGSIKDGIFLDYLRASVSTVLHGVYLLYN